MFQLHKRFTSDQVKELLERYLKNEIKRKYIQEILGIKRRRFFMLLKEYKENPQRFTIQYQRTTPSRSISPKIEQNILKELAIEKKLIEDKEIPLRSYNYSYIKNRLDKTYHQRVSLNTIIDRAKKQGFYLKKTQKAVHDREVLTHYVGELIQHDSSSMPLWSRQKTAGPIFWPSKPSSFNMDSLTLIMSIPIPSFGLSREGTRSGENIIFLPTKPPLNGNKSWRIAM